MNQDPPQIGIAVKRLAAVEVDPTRSHQHELNAGGLRRELGLAEVADRSLLAVVYRADDQPPTVNEGTYTLYDARKAIPGRTEYRLYYRTDLMQGAQEGDLLILFRDSDQQALRAIVAGRGTSVEARLMHLLKVEDTAGLEEFLFVAPPRPSAKEGIDAGDALVGQTTRVGAHDVRAHPLFEEAVTTLALPKTRTMAQAGHDLAVADLGTSADPDLLLESALDAETELYYAISERLREPELADLIARGADVQAFLTWAMRVHQSARSRRGTSLQNHLGHLLDREGIPHSPQCQTEPPRKPDFVIPGCEQYHDLKFPENRLRMVACKSTIRERWPQILPEAARIPEKYLLTLDQDLTASVIRDMTDARLRPFLPQGTINAHYQGNSELDHLGNVADLLTAIQTAFV